MAWKPPATSSIRGHPRLSCQDFGHSWLLFLSTLQGPTSIAVPWLFSGLLSSAGGVGATCAGLEKGLGEGYGRMQPSPQHPVRAVCIIEYIRPPLVNPASLRTMVTTELIFAK